MAATVLTAVTVIGTGIAINSSAVVTAGTITTTVTDLSRTFVTLANDSTTASTIVTFSASDVPMVAEGIGSLAITVGTAETQYVGGSWDSSRLKGTAGTIVMTFAAAATITVDVGYLTPY